MIIKKGVSKFPTHNIKWTILFHKIVFPFILLDPTLIWKYKTLFETVLNAQTYKHIRCDNARTTVLLSIDRHIRVISSVILYLIIFKKKKK